MTNPTNPQLDDLAERLQRVLSAERSPDAADAADAATDGAVTTATTSPMAVRHLRKRTMFTAPNHVRVTPTTRLAPAGPATPATPPVPTGEARVALTNTSVTSIPRPISVTDVPGAFLPYDSEVAQATLHGQIDRIYRLCYRMAYRLLGRRQLAEAIAADAVRSVVAQPKLGPPAHLALGYVLETILGHYGELRSGRTPGDTSAVVHAEHRDRLARELRRNSPADRLILAIRHLGGLGVDDTAVIVGKSVSSVRKVTSRWTPEDDLDPAGELITNLDAWTPPENPEQTEGATLAHLDDPLVGAQPAVRGVADLPPQTLAHALTAAG